MCLSLCAMQSSTREASLRPSRCRTANRQRIRDGTKSSGTSLAALLAARLFTTRHSFSPGIRAPASATSEMHREKECLRSEEHTSELQSLAYLVCRLLLE